MLEVQKGSVVIGSLNLPGRKGGPRPDQPFALVVDSFACIYSTFYLYIPRSHLIQNDSHFFLIGRLNLVMSD